MPIYAKTKRGNRLKQFPIVSEGTRALVLAAVQSLGVVQTSYGPKEKLRFVWLSTEVDGKTDKPLSILQTMNNTLHVESELYKTLKAMAVGTVDETTDLETFVGTQVTAEIVHNQARDGSRTFANIDRFLKLDPNQPKVMIPTGWAPPKIRTNTNLPSDKEIPF